MLTSDAIVIGTVAGIEGRGENGKGSGTRTYVTVKVNEVIQGQNIGGTIEVKTHLSTRPDAPDYGLPRFSIDEKVLLLLTKHENTTGVFWMRDSYKGKFTSINGRIAGSSIKWEDFKRQIREVLAGARTTIVLDSRAAKTAHTGSHLDGQFVTCASMLPAATPLTFKINPANARDPNGNPLSFNSIKTALQTAINNSWNGISASSIRFQIDQDSTTLGSAYDDHSVICWTDLGSPDDIGAQNNNYKLHPSTRKYISVDIEFNSQLNWSVSDTYPSPCDPDDGPKDFQNVAVHELGHALALNHCSNTYTQNTMYYQASRCETGQRSLEPGDKAGSVYLGANGIGGDIQFDTVWLGGGSLPLTGGSLTLSGNVTVPTGKTLTIETGKTINLNGYYLKSTGGTITDNGATWNPNIAVKQGGTLKGRYSTIQSAINAASSGQTVYVGARTYTEQVSMKSGVDVFGPETGTATIQYSGGTGVTFNNDSARLSRFTVKGYNAIDIQSSSNAEVDHCTITDSYVGIDVYNCSPKIHHNTIYGNGDEDGGGGVYAGTSSDPRMYADYGQNTIRDNGYGIYCYSSSEPQLGSGNNHGLNNIRNNDTYNLTAHSNCDMIYAENN
ncbi:MAG: hypothetical protein J7M27_11790 [Candidatus Latescibacteria bacterium]|nr:hypothetical protein [Candidatus Latescibacterota bacterium]